MHEWYQCHWHRLPDNDLLSVECEVKPLAYLLIANTAKIADFGHMIALFHSLRVYWSWNSTSCCKPGSTHGWILALGRHITMYFGVH